jgi:hypothetical protein
MKYLGLNFFKNDEAGIAKINVIDTFTGTKIVDNEFVDLLQKDKDATTNLYEKFTYWITLPYNDENRYQWKVEHSTYVNPEAVGNVLGINFDGYLIQEEVKPGHIEKTVYLVDSVNNLEYNIPISGVLWNSETLEWELQNEIVTELYQTTSLLGNGITTTFKIGDSSLKNYEFIRFSLDDRLSYKYPTELTITWGSNTNSYDDKIINTTGEFWINFIDAPNSGAIILVDTLPIFDSARIEFVINQPEEKEKKLELKRLRTKEGKIEARNKILDKYSKEINEYNDILQNSYLKKLEQQIKNNKVLNDYLVSSRAKKSYTNLFNQQLKKPEKLVRYFGYDLKIDSLIYERNTFSWEYESYKKRESIHIIQYYNIKDNNFKYQIYFNFPLTWWDIDYNLPKFDSNKESEFIDARNDAINKFKKSGLTRTELETIIMKVTYLLSDECYEKWKFQQDTNKYNL